MDNLECKNKYIVYKHTFPNNKVYIGITSKNNVIERWGANGNGYKSQPVYNAIQYFGWENIQHEILYKDLSLEEAQKMERDLIIQYDSKLNGYNSTDGGEAHPDEEILFEYNDKLYTPENLAKLGVN